MNSSRSIRSLIQTHSTFKAVLPSFFCKVSSQTLTLPTRLARQNLQRSPLIAILLLLFGCITPQSVEWGIQPEYQALNPSRILAITPIVLALPADPDSNIDPTVLQTVPVIASLEGQVLTAFTRQPGVNGMSFSAVRSQLEKEKSTAFDQLVKALNDTVSLLRNPPKEQRGRLATSCIKRRNFLEFYQFCLSDQMSWRNNLNQLAQDVLNADAALFLFITQLEKKSRERVATTTVHALLVDTNNAGLIWAGSQKTAVKDDATEKPAALWDAVLSQAAAEELWQGFPGRLPNTSESVSPDEPPTTHAESGSRSPFKGESAK